MKKKKSSLKNWIIFFLIVYITLILFGAIYIPLLPKSKLKIEQFKPIIGSSYQSFPINFSVKNPQLKEVNLTLNFSYDNELFELKELYYINNSSKIIILKNNTINSFTLQKQEKIDFFSTLSTKKIQLKHKAKNHEIEISTIFKDKKSSSDTLEVYVVN